MTERIDCAVIGAGVVGLAVARELALAGREVLVLESESGIGEHTSSRNSEVIHAGIYYPKGSLKARLCVAGKHLLYDYCRDHGVPHANCGKIIVASRAEEVDAVRSYIPTAAAAGVHDLREMDVAEVRELEPEVVAVAAVMSPSTGIVDSHALMLSYLGDAENAGAMAVFRSPVRRGEVTDDGILLDVGGDEPMQILCNTVVNSAGLFAPQVARSIAGVPESTIPGQYYAKAHYFTLSGKPPFSRLIYPVGHGSWLGVHVTIDLGGQVRFGPDIEWVDSVDYSFDLAREPLFCEAIRRYYPNLKDGALQPGYTGIRPKISAKGETPADFRIDGPEAHGIRGLVNLFGIESPGLTASLAIAQEVRQRLEA
ncbi:MAG: FAD-dependent oxidoreductase [Betaproteobacteria bacterium]|nr:FAD-dependent oxidoreductase [Betaproteobacteria bacterium]